MQHLQGESQPQVYILSTHIFYLFIFLHFFFKASQLYALLGFPVHARLCLTLAARWTRTREEMVVLFVCEEQSDGELLQ